MNMALFCLALATFICIGHSDATLSCNQTVIPESYAIRKSREATNLEFNNRAINLPLEQCPLNVLNDNIMCGYSIILGNRSNVSHPPDLNNTMYLSYFVAFKRDLLVSITFDFAEITSNITAIELSFLNSPTNGISLPDIAINEIERGTMNIIPIESRILDNQDLAYTDNQIRTVFIQPDMLLSRINLNMRFEFSIFHYFDWLFLSNIRFCTDSQMSQSDLNSTKVAVFTTPMFNTVQPSANDLSRGLIELVCSVSSEGRYMWVWERDNIKINNTSKYQITVGDGSRTTVLKIFNLSFSDIAKYKCLETTNNQAQFAEFSVEYPEFVDAELNSEGILHTGEVTLNCKLHGYQSSLTPPVWLDRNGSEIINTSSKYTLSKFNGPQTIILENGTTVPSITLSITIHNISYDDEGNYTCRGVRGAENVTQLTIVEGIISTTTLSSQLWLTTKGMQTLSPDTTTPPTLTPFPTVIIIAVAMVTAILVFTIMGICITSMALIIVRHRKTSSSSNQNQNHYIDIDFHSEGNNDLNGEVRESVIDLIALENLPTFEMSVRHEELEYEDGTLYEQPGIDRTRAAIATRRDTNETFPNLVKVARTNFEEALEDNPIYDSTQNLGEQLLLSNEVLYCGADDILSDDTLLEPNPMYDSTQNYPMYDDADAILSKKEPVYNELLTAPVFHGKKHSPTDKSNLDDCEHFEDDDNSNANIYPLEPIYDNPSKVITKSISIESENVCEVSVLGIGQFGEVMLAETVGLSEKDLKLGDNTDKNARFLVAVKKLKHRADSDMKESFEKEISFMSGLSDDNIVRLLAVCNKEPKFIVIEYMENGDLFQFLNRHELTPYATTTQENELQVSTLLYMSVQIASGMKYLASLNFVHRDLASRNCLVGQNFAVKISDFGMSRNLYESVYYRVRGRAMLPIRWMATESFYGVFSEKTDIWSFGVTMWEIFTLGRFQPYKGIQDQQVINEAVKNHRRTLLSKPEACPEEVYSVMLRCWEHKLEDRADFAEVYKSLDSLNCKGHTY